MSVTAIEVYEIYKLEFYRMFPTLVACGSSLLKYVDKYAEKGQTVEVRDILARYTTNIIASVGQI